MSASKVKAAVKWGCTAVAACIGVAWLVQAISIVTWTSNYMNSESHSVNWLSDVVWALVKVPLWIPFMVTAPVAIVLWKREQRAK